MMQVMATGDSLGTRIAKRRQVLGLTQEQLAARLGVSKTSVAKWETGKHYPQRHAGALEEVLGIRLDGSGETPDFDPDDPDEVRIMGWTELPYTRRLTMIAELRAARRAARSTA